MNFQHHYSSLKSHDPSEITLICVFDALKILLINSCVKNNSGIFDGYKVQKNSIYLKYNLLENYKCLYCHFNASLLNEIIHFFQIHKQIVLTPN